VEAARYTVLSAEATVKEANENLSLTSIHAPMSGIITKLSVEKGERVVGTQQMTGTEMLRIANLNAMEVRVNVNENDIIRVSKGDTAVIDVDAYTYKGVKFKGRVVAIANSANESAGISESVTEFEVRIIIDPASYMPLMKEQGFFPFRPGMTASVDIITEERSQVLSVPLAAVTTRSPKSDKGPGRGEKPQGDEKAKPDEEVKEVVFVVRADTVAMVTVTTGISDFDHIEVLSGIEEGMEVVEGPFIMVSRMLEDGDKVKPMGAAGKPKAE
jgi:HlyD family secretion protein